MYWWLPVTDHRIARTSSGRILQASAESRTYESWMIDGFNFEPTGDTGPLGTANNVVKEHGITREESDALVLDRYKKYLMSTADDRKFQKRYMLPVEVRLSKKKTILVEADEGITPCTAEGLAGLKTIGPDSIMTVGCPDPCGRWECRHDRHHKGESGFSFPPTRP